MVRRQIGQILKELGVIDDRQLAAGLNHQRGKAQKLGEALIELGFATEEEIARALAKQHRLPFVDLDKAGRIPDQIVEKIPRNIAEQYGILPLTIKKGKLAVAVDDPTKVISLDELRFVLNMELLPVLATPDALKRTLAACYQGEGDTEAMLARETRGIDGEADEAPIIRLVSLMIEAAVKQRASDIHIEPQSDRIRIRFRIDGVLRESANHPLHLHGPLLSRLKIMAGMDIAEKRKPQDGQIHLKVMSRDMDIRASVLPSNWGESIVMRLLDKETSLVSLEVLGFYEEDYQRFKNIIKRPNGIFLVTGPTGSGKTTTLYAALQELNRSDVKLITAEDPVEYHIRGINQVQVKHQIGLSFSRILRSMLRQAPDIILVGEIRDRETAEIAIQAALTGHLVFSTLHTNDAPSALTRLIDMNVKPFLVSSSVQAVMAQRLIRTLCEDCKKPVEPEPTDLAALGLTESDAGGRTIFEAQGCPKCEFTGYLGRTGIFELMEIDWILRDMTFKKEPTLNIRNQAVRSGLMTPLLQDGIRKILTGRSSIREILRAVKTAGED
ncbi:MAG: GspE/PulE family protein [Planctomycetota bacterium]|jgi:type IV pilus assembly protein PilB